MNKTKRYILSLIVLIGLLAIPTLAVFAKELGLLTISGPGIRGELTLNGPGQWGKLEDSSFFVQENFIEQAPENLGQGYTLIASLELDGKMTPFVKMVYYPAEKGQPGYFHYTARLDGKALQPLDDWGISSLQGDQAFRALMHSNNITVQSAILSVPETRSASSPVAPFQVPYGVLIVTTALLASLGGTFIVWRRRIASQHSP